MGRVACQCDINRLARDKCLYTAHKKQEDHWTEEILTKLTCSR